MSKTLNLILKYKWYEKSKKGKKQKNTGNINHIGINVSLIRNTLNLIKSGSKKDIADVQLIESLNK